MFLYEPEAGEGDELPAGANLRLRVAKQRSGPVGDVDLWFVRNRGRFREPALPGGEAQV